MKHNIVHTTCMCSKPPENKIEHGTFQHICPIQNPSLKRKINLPHHIFDYFHQQATTNTTFYRFSTKTPHLEPYPNRARCSVFFLDSFSWAKKPPKCSVLAPWKTSSLNERADRSIGKSEERQTLCGVFGTAGGGESREMPCPRFSREFGCFFCLFVFFFVFFQFSVFFFFLYGFCWRALLWCFGGCCLA